MTTILFSGGPWNGCAIPADWLDYISDVTELESQHRVIRLLNPKTSHLHAYVVRGNVAQWYASMSLGGTVTMTGPEAVAALDQEKQDRAEVDAFLRSFRP